MARSAVGHVPLRLPADRAGGVSRDARLAATDLPTDPKSRSDSFRLSRLHVYRPRLRQGTHAFDGVRLSFPQNNRRGTSACAAPDRGAEFAPIQECIAEMLRAGSQLR